MGTRAIDQELVIDLARTVVQEVAPDEIPLFAETSRAYFRRRVRPGRDRGINARDPLGMGVDAWHHVITYAALSTIQSVLIFICVEFKKGLEEEGASIIRAWIKRGFRRLASAENGKLEEGSQRSLTDPLTRQQLSIVREYAYAQAIPFKMSHDKAEKMADTIVARLALHGLRSDDD